MVRKQSNLISCGEYDPATERQAKVNVSRTWQRALGRRARTVYGYRAVRYEIPREVLIFER
jgi:hypothetical protein